MLIDRKVRFGRFTVLVITLAVICWLEFNHQNKKHFFFNLTKSMPRGLYKIINQPPTTGSLVIVDLLSKRKKFFVERGYINQDTLLLKNILASEGDFVCQHNYEILIEQSYQNFKLPVKKLDRVGRKLIGTKICRKLKADEFFVGSIDKNYSLDSRYFGIISSSEIISTVNHILRDSS